MAKLKTPPINTRCDKCKGELKSEYWINKTNFHWMIGDKDTGVDSRGNPGPPGISESVYKETEW